jgi:hypothetical protein
MRLERRSIAESDPLRPLRADLVVIPLSKPGQRAFKLVDQQRTGGFEFELYELEYAVATSLDGKRCATDIVRVLVEAGFTVRTKQVLSFYRELDGMGFIDKGVAAAERAQAAAADHSSDLIAFVRQGTAYLGEHKLDFARQYFQAALAIDPSNQLALDGLVECDRLKAQHRTPLPRRLPKLDLAGDDYDDESATTVDPHADIAGELDVPPPRPMVPAPPGYTPRAAYATPVPSVPVQQAAESVYANPYSTPMPPMPPPVVYPTHPPPYAAPTPPTTYPMGTDAAHANPFLAPPHTIAHHEAEVYPVQPPRTAVAAKAAGANKAIMAGLVVGAIVAVIAFLQVSGRGDGEAATPDGAIAAAASAPPTAPATRVAAIAAPNTALKPAAATPAAAPAAAAANAEPAPAEAAIVEPVGALEPPVPTPTEPVAAAPTAATIAARVARVEPRAGRLVAPIAGTGTSVPSDGTRLRRGEVVLTISHSSGSNRDGKAYQVAAAKVAELESLAKSDPDTYKAFLERARANLARVGGPVTTTRQVRAPHSGKLELDTRRNATVRAGEMLGVVRDDRGARVTLAADPALSAVTPRWRCALVGAKASCKVLSNRSGEVSLELSTTSTPITSDTKVELSSR